MHIGELAEETGLSLRTIRHYDDVGLLPATSRTEGGFRVYTEADLARLLVIRSMKPLGFTLEEMAELLDALGRLDGVDPSPGDEALLVSYISEATAKREKLARNLRQADEFIHSLQTR
ncbi:MerR family transcriptional regulator [Arthrobacter sp. AET 35A]|uniref:MerR family transcriptional regulator n=1 Tax=Arthrobacter sp. AET 35A TaxID=2292643 RepID=UPI00178688AD|nr:MerR family transcriptional regulator [Arthrobacter sp. AET 35A]MBE0011342.1 MerR family transcriptional regulator [Arthrobacter sp. AET 35A]